MLNCPSPFSRIRCTIPGTRSPRGGEGPSSSWAENSRGNFRFRLIPERRFRDYSLERLRGWNWAGKKIQCFQRRRSRSSNSILFVGWKKDWNRRLNFLYAWQFDVMDGTNVNWIKTSCAFFGFCHIFWLANWLGSEIRASDWLKMWQIKYYMTA